MKEKEYEILEKTQEAAVEGISTVLEQGIQTTNLDYLYKLVDIYKDTKEVDSMRYNGYGYGYDNYNYGRENYGENYNDRYEARGRGSNARRDSRGRYRGDEYMDRMAGEFGNYQESRSRYGAGEETDKAFHYMVKAYEEFTKYLFEEAETPQQKQMLREAVQKSMM